MFRLLVSGSREWDQPEVLQMVLLQEWSMHSDDLVIVHGDCPRGADKMARDFAEKHGIPQERHPARWEQYGKSAGFRRNKVMVDSHPSKAVFFVRGESRGTRGCLKLAREAGISYVVYGDAA